MRNAASLAKWWAAGIDDDDGATASGRRLSVIPPDSAYAAVSNSGEAQRWCSGDENEREILARVLNGARSGHGSTIVLPGDPGIGKSTLLSYAIDSAAGFQVLRTVGNEAENEFPFAAAQQLCIPGLAALEDLPAPQREALGVAFGHITGPVPTDCSWASLFWAYFPSWLPRIPSCVSLTTPSGLIESRLRRSPSRLVGWGRNMSCSCSALEPS
jgi:hypothetical protein